MRTCEGTRACSHAATDACIPESTCAPFLTPHVLPCMRTPARDYAHACSRVPVVFPLLQVFVSWCALVQAVMHTAAHLSWNTRMFSCTHRRVSVALGLRHWLERMVKMPCSQRTHQNGGSMISCVRVSSYILHAQSYCVVITRHSTSDISLHKQCLVACYLDGKKPFGKTFN